MTPQRHNSSAIFAYFAHPKAMVYTEALRGINMKKYLPSALFAFLAPASALFFSATTWAAQCGATKTSIDFGCKAEGVDTVTSVLLYVINFLAVGVGIAVVGGIVWGGLVYAQSDGDSGKVKEAIDIIRNAIIGLVLFIFMYAIVNFLVPGGLFN